MRPRQRLPKNLPRLWLMTDERIGEGLWPALERLPGGSGVVFRHYRTVPSARRALFERVRRIARARGLVLVLAGTAREALAWRANGVHGRASSRPGRRMLRTAPVHDAREMIAALRGGADLVFVSPVFATRSHPGGRTLGVKGFGRLARFGEAWIPARAGMTARIIALGGMDAGRFRRLRLLGAYGWAGIDALTP